MGIPATEGGTVQFPSLERPEKINSIYLQKGKIRLGYGLFINNDRIIGVRASRWYLLASVIHAPILIVSSLWGFLLLFLGFGFGPGSTRSSWSRPWRGSCGEKNTRSTS